MRASERDREGGGETMEKGRSVLFIGFNVKLGRIFGQVDVSVYIDVVRGKKKKIKKKKKKKKKRKKEKKHVRTIRVPRYRDVYMEGGGGIFR